jgi:NADPH:quinone reductase-like Zn-dependent oxidoreductase
MLPRSMMAVRLFEYGDPSVLRYVEVPLPDMGPDEVLVRVRATSVTRWDLRYRQGLLTAPPGRVPLALPFQLGRDAAGEVAAVGAQVKTFRPGDRVVAMTCPACGECEYCRRGLDNLCVDIGLPGHQRFGAYAQYVSRKSSELLHAPESVPFEKLACLLWSYSTVWHMAIHRGRLGPGQQLLITAASGGMGTAAIQVAKLAGAGKIIAVTGAAHKVERLLALGATHVLNHRDEDVPARIVEMTNGLGVDLALENVGGEMLPLCMQCLRMDGTVVSAGQHGGRYCTVDVELLYRRHLNVLGTRGASRHEQQLVLALAAQDRLDPVISQVLPLSEAAEAHRLLERREQVGKIVLVA